MKTLLKMPILVLAMQSLLNAASAGEVTCPTTVRAGKPLTVNVTLSNSKPEPVTVSRLVVSLIGNSGRSGNSGLQGPFLQSLTSTAEVPAAQGEYPCAYYDPEQQTCDIYSQVWYATIEGTKTLENVQIIKAVPGGMRGQLASAVVAYIDSNKKLHEVGYCMVEVIK